MAKLTVIVFALLTLIFSATSMTIADGGSQPDEQIEQIIRSEKMPFSGYIRWGPNFQAKIQASQSTVVTSINTIGPVSVYSVDDAVSSSWDSEVCPLGVIIRYQQDEMGIQGIEVHNTSGSYLLVKSGVAEVELEPEETYNMASSRVEVESPSETGWLPCADLKLYRR